MSIFRHFIGRKSDRVPILEPEDDRDFIPRQIFRELADLTNHSPVHRLASALTSSPKVKIRNQKLELSFGKKGRGKEQLSRPGGVTVTNEGDIVVVDTDNCRVLIFDSLGQLKQTIGGRGHEPQQLNQPSDVALFSHEGTDCLLVSDSVNSCLKLFNFAGEFLDCFRSNVGSLEYPCGVAVSRDQNVVATDLINHAVVVLSPHGSEVTKFGSYGEGPNELDHPYYIAVDTHDNVVVSDHGNMAIKFFTMTGLLLYRFTVEDFHIYREDFVQLQGVTVDTDGNIIVVGDNMVYIVANNGRFWEVIPPCEGLQSLKGVAYAPSGCIVLTRDASYNEDQVYVFKYEVGNFRSLRAVPRPSQGTSGSERKNRSHALDTDSTPAKKECRTSPAKPCLSSKEDKTTHNLTRTHSKKSVTFSEKTEEEFIEKSSNNEDETYTFDDDDNKVTTTMSSHIQGEYIIGRQIPTLDYDLIERKRRLRAKSQIRTSPAHIFNFS